MRRRTPNHHRTGLIGDDYPIDPYKRGEMTDDPYNRYWTEESMKLSARKPNHHRTGLIGDDYPIDPYKRGQMTDDPYNRYWTEESMTLSARKHNPDEPEEESRFQRAKHWARGAIDTGRDYGYKAKRAIAPIVVGVYAAPLAPVASKLISMTPDERPDDFGDKIADKILGPRKANYGRADNPASLYTVAVDGHPVYSSHLRDQAMRRFMNQRTSARGEVTMSIDGDVAYRAGRGGSMRVGNPEESVFSSMRKSMLAAERAANPPPGKFTIDGRLAENRNYRFAPGANLQSAQLAALDLRGADLTGSNLKYADLRYADLRDCKLDGADFTGSDLRQANFSGASLDGAIFKKALMIGAILEDCDLDHIQLNDIDASYVDFDNSSLVGANFKDSDLTRALFNNAELARANFERANLRRAEFFGADLDEANFRTADLRGAYYLEHAQNAGTADFYHAQAYREDLGPFLDRYPGTSSSFAYKIKPVEPPRGPAKGGARDPRPRKDED